MVSKWCRILYIHSTSANGVAFKGTKGKPLISGGGGGGPVACFSCRVPFWVAIKGNRRTTHWFRGVPVVQLFRRVFAQLLQSSDPPKAVGTLSGTGTQFSDPGKKGSPFWGRPFLVGRPPKKGENKVLLNN